MSVRKFSLAVKAPENCVLNTNCALVELTSDNALRKALEIMFPRISPTKKEIVFKSLSKHRKIEMREEDEAINLTLESISHRIKLLIAFYDRFTAF